MFSIGKVNPKDPIPSNKRTLECQIKGDLNVLQV